MPGSENSTAAWQQNKINLVEFLLPGMPITKSAKKALRQSKRRELRNSRTKRRLKKLEKEIKKASAQKDGVKAKELLPLFYKALDKAAQTGLIKKNLAARKKSRITILVGKKGPK